MHYEIPYKIISSELPVVSAAAFLKLYPACGHVFQVRHLGLSFYFLRKQLCCGLDSQAIAPVTRENVIPCVFLESCPYPANEPRLEDIVRRGLTAPVQDVQEAVPLFAPGALNLWHWTLESLPKLLVLEAVGYTGKYIVPAAIDGPRGEVVRQNLEMFGIGPERLLRSGYLYRVERLVLPQRLSGFDLPEKLDLCDFVRQRLLQTVGVLSGKKRIYIRRIGRRRVLNEDAVLAILHEYGFEIMTPEELSLPEQWRNMTNVECSVMAHGANSTLTFLQPGRSGFIELFSNRYVSYNNLHAVRLLRLHYYPLVEDLDVSSYPNEQTSVAHFMQKGLSADMAVDTLHLRTALESVLG